MKDKLPIINLQRHAHPAIPTSDDIYIRIRENGKNRRVAVVEKINTSKNQETNDQRAFGEPEPVGSYGGGRTYELSFTTVYMLDEAYNDGIFFDELHDFDVVVEKPDRSEVYKGCNWTSIDETMDLGEKVATDISVKPGGYERIMK